MSRLGNEAIEVELFLRTKGRLPNQEGDKITKALAKEFLDKCHNGEVAKEYHYIMDFAFHVFASSNKDYEP
jgi:hypothetical protein